MPTFYLLTAAETDVLPYLPGAEEAIEEQAEHWQRDKGMETVVLTIAERQINQERIC
jgi:hypothetical protein